MKKLIVATRNKGKLKEIKDILKGINMNIIGLEDIKFNEDIEESGNSFKENAVIKAQSIGKITGLLTLGEDSGLEIDALGGGPSIRSARYVKGSDLDRINKVLEELKGVPREKRTARFRAVVAIYDPKSGKTYTFEGSSEGLITETPSGKNGFGYDPIFYNLDLGKTNGEATSKDKNRVSHRARALSEAKKLFLSLGV